MEIETLMYYGIHNITKHLERDFFPKKETKIFKNLEYIVSCRKLHSLQPCSQKMMNPINKGAFILAQYLVLRNVAIELSNVML